MKFDYQLRATILVCAATFGASALLIACGSGSTESPVATIPASYELSGTAANGAAYPKDTKITVKDAAGVDTDAWTVPTGA